MITFKLLTESIRQGLPHISTMSHEQLTNLTRGGRVYLHHVTEKTDGSTFMIGHDKDGFYTQSSGSGSERMRTPQDYLDRVTRRSQETGKEPDYTGARAFADAHEALQRNSKLVDHLRSHAESRGGETQLRGELFSRQLARPSEDRKGEVKLVGTSYDPSSWGSRAKVVIHSRLPENQTHDIEHFKRNLSNDEVNFDDDIIEHKPTHVDVSRHTSGLSSIDHELLRARTTNSNRTAKQAEQAKLSTIAKAISDDVDEHVRKMGIAPKFGSGSEGAVVHPSAANPNAPRFKVTSDTFRAYKADPTNKEKFKKRTIAQIKESFLTEGGNIKVKTPEGVVSAAPFKVEDRTQQRGDVSTALSAIHDAFHQEHGEHLFGKGQKGLRSGSIYGGSTRHFMDSSISDDEFKKHKPTVGDFDVQVTHEHKDKLTSTLQPGRRFGAYTVVGMKKHGSENSAVMRHDNGQHHQFDFEATDYDKDEPTKASQFLHSADWDDTKAGIKGAHHKILLNAAGGNTHKFSITHGLRSRTDDSDPGTKEPTEISRTLFGDKADHSRVHSFLGVADLIKRHIPQERHQEIYDKFKSGLKSVPNTDHGPALKHLRDTLGVKDSLDEATENNDHHTSVIPMVGFSPISHMGHAADLGGSLASLPGTKHVGISGKSDVFSADERKDILSRQWGQGGQSVHIVKGAGETIRHAYDSLPEGRRHLHILVGHDRREFAEGLKKSLEAGKIREMGDNKFDSVTLHYPKDTDRSHGMSGTRMRQAAARGDVDEVHRHLGPSFSREEAESITKRMKGAIDSGKLKLVRESEIKIGQILDRESMMPQIDDTDDFSKYLKDNLVRVRKRMMDGGELRSSQLNFDKEKVQDMIANPSNKAIVVSNDDHVLDGHHRWIANQQMGRKCLALQVDMPILDLIKTAKDYNNRLNEETLNDIGELNHEKFGPMLDTFVQFASKKLGIKSLPSMKLEKEPMETSFGGYNPADKSIVVITRNRHPMDIYRTVAHELVHHKQNEDGRLGKDIAKEGSTGSPIENEANSEAGKIMRWFAKSNPEMFKSGYVTEETLTEKKRGSLSLKNWFDKSKSKDGKKGWVQVGGRYDGKPCARQPGQTSTPKCRSSAERARMSKKEREYAFKKKQREDPNQPQKSGAAKPTMVKTYKHQEESYHMDKKTLQEKKDACYHKVKSRYKVWPSAYASGALVKCRKVGADSWGNKSKVDENFENFFEETDRKDTSKREWGKTSLTNMYKKDTPGQGKKKLAKEDNTIPRGGIGNFGSSGEGPETTFYRPMVASGFGGAGTIPMYESVEEWANNPIVQERFVKKYGHRAREKLMEAAERLSDLELNQKGPKFFTHLREGWSYGKDPNDRMGTLPSQGKEEMTEEDEDVIKPSKSIKGYKKHIHPMSRFEKKSLGEERTHVVSKGQTVSGIAKQYGITLDRFKELNPDIKNINKIGIGQKFNVGAAPAPKEPQAKTPEPVKPEPKEVEAQKGPEQPAPRATGLDPMNPGFHAHVKYKMDSARAADDQTNFRMPQQDQDVANVRAAQKRNSTIGSRYGEKGPDDPYGDLEGAKKAMQESEAWQRKEGKNPEGGLNRKGIESYRRANPGSKLSLAVTTPPSKLKKGSKSAKRRLSFCRRMKGMKKKLTSAKTARDPDSRINKSLRKWNCEE